MHSEGSGSGQRGVRVPPGTKLLPARRLFKACLAFDTPEKQGSMCGWTSRNIHHK